MKAKLFGPDLPASAGATVTPRRAEGPIVGNPSDKKVVLFPVLISVINRGNFTPMCQIHNRNKIMKYNETNAMKTVEEY